MCFSIFTVSFFDSRSSYQVYVLYFVKESTAAHCASVRPKAIGFSLLIDLIVTDKRRNKIFAAYS